MTRDELGREIASFWTIYIGVAASAFFMGAVVGWFLFFLTIT